MKLGRLKAMLSATWVILALFAVIAAIVVGSVVPVVTREIRHPRTKLTTTPSAERDK
jgi:hypothetical protein